ncbi:Biotin synthase [Actinidia chinensis var. chinensis]|uniref:Biotin synthase n=1 Tax=Actinidia chinensis var. chinensis TaxID=1590841 RepID=A0A2R6PLT8_ACTCC|nr:Biotin synthase [Actinidia chinensis var. chinensis]
MPKWDFSATKSETRNFKLHLMVCDLEGLSPAAIPNKKNYTIKIQVEWAVSKRKYISRRTTERNHTSNQCINSDGCVCWNESFYHECKLKLKNAMSFSSRMINLQVHGSNLEPNRRVSVLAKIRLDIAKIAGETETSEKIIKFPVRCCIGGSTVESRLTVKLNSFEFHPVHNSSIVHPLSPIQLLPSLSSCIRYQSTTSNEMDNSSSESDKEDEPSYRSLEATNLLLESLVDDKLEYCKEDTQKNNQQYQTVHKPSLTRLLSWKNLRVSFRVPEHPRDTPLLNKVYGEDGGDDIDNDRRCHLSPLQQGQGEVQSDLQPFGFMGSDRFEIGNWERRKLVSRDGSLVLVTEIFLASIDQRSEKASGEGACTVLAAVIADWLHQNPGILPLRCQFDKLIREGSLEWRNLCQEEANREKFTDQHFDLDTVLQAQVRPLKVVQKKSYVGFFELENIPNQFEFLQGVMSFDSIWEELQSRESRMAEEIYIVCWNDHFFVLKIEVDAIYIIDTLGERLFEGCTKAYILKFNKESKLYRMQPKVDSEKHAENQASNTGEKVDTGCSQKTKICEGKSSCKEFIKGFLAAIPLRELQTSIQSGITGGTPLHHLLQIEFQYTTTCNNTTNHGEQILVNQACEEGIEDCISPSDDKEP